MVSRLDRDRADGGTLLVCTDCGQPLPPSRDALRRQRRLWNLATLLGLVFAGGVLFVMSTLMDATNQPLEAPRREQAGEG